VQVVNQEGVVVQEGTTATLVEARATLALSQVPEGDDRNAA
jgi:hypothetical protein